MANAITPEDQPDIDLRAVAPVLATFGQDLRDCRVERPRQASGFSGALILRVSRAERIWCLRRWPRKGLGRPRLMALHDLLRSLGATGIGVLPTPCVTDAGRTLVEHDGWLWQLEPWMPGKADFHQHPTDERLRTAMRTLAEIHRAAERYAAPAEARQWFDRHPATPAPACRERRQILHAWSAPRRDQARSRLEATAPAPFRRLALDVYEGTTPLGQVRPEPGRPVCLAVGPERGWGGRDRKLLRDSGFELLSLNERVLRVETAVTVGLTLLLHNMGVY